MLLARKSYPRQAQRLGQQGVVTVQAQFAADGELLGCEVAASSGFRALDEAAVELVRIAAAQLRASGAPGSRAQVRIPIAYELNGRGT
ncbi:MAG: energy transducer TonB [Burkholderiaceae bacterium]|nr:energy transducer TonB [Burkholderiaceae bacterium]